MFCNLDCCKEGPVNQQKEVLQENMKLFFLVGFDVSIFSFLFFSRNIHLPCYLVLSNGLT